MDFRIIGFIAAGGTATALNFLVFLALFSNSGLPTFSSAVGYMSGVLVSYLLNKYIVFKSSKKASIARYFLAYSLALASQLTLLNVFMSLGLPAEAANALAVSIIVVLNFYLVRLFVFR